ncbi:acetyl-CoA acetyltransferase, partial [Sphingobium indicum]|uniref:acetyl-CoA acetyltransferase n=1 Tax=Sphingobium indicum TaxID=332055 RepID=UPI000559DFF3
MPRGIKDKVAILGMGCSRFGERFDSSPEDLMVEAYVEALEDAGIEPTQLDAAWYSTHIADVGTGRGGTPLSIALRLPNIGVTRVENFCAGGSEAVRNAAYAVASGACDIALALGVEKLKDSGYAGLPVATVGTYIPQWYPGAVAPANFAQLATAYRAKHGVDAALLKRAMAHVSIKSHANAVKNPKAHLRKAITEDQVLNAPMIAEPLGLFDCSGVSDGAAAAILTTPEIARAMGKKDIVSFKALQIAVSNGWELQD